MPPLPFPLPGIGVVLVDLGALDVLGALVTVGVPGTGSDPEFVFGPPDLFPLLPCGVAPITARTRLRPSRAAKVALLPKIIVGFIENYLPQRV